MIFKTGTLTNLNDPTKDIDLLKESSKILESSVYEINIVSLGTKVTCYRLKKAKKLFLIQEMIFCYNISEISTKVGFLN